MSDRGLRGSAEQSFGENRERRRRVTALVTGAALIMTATFASPANAESQNEVTIQRWFDGTARFSAVDQENPTDNEGAAPAAHTPGQDSGDKNYVVRTFDGFGVRVDWDVNEAAATDVWLTVTLAVRDNPGGPAAAEVKWVPGDAGMFAGCLAESSVTSDGLTLLCQLGDEPEGSHGTISPAASLGAGVDGSMIDVSVTLTSDQDDSGAVRDDLSTPLTVSEAPQVNWIKRSPTFSAEPVGTGDDAGYVVLFPFTMSTDNLGTSPDKGSGYVDSAVPITLYDHAWDIAANSRLATAAEIAAAQAEGNAIYGDVVGAYDSRNRQSIPTTTGQWSFDPIGQPNGYPVWELTVKNYSAQLPDLDSDGVPDSNANGTPNDSNVIVSGQLILWMDADDVEADMFPQDSGAVNYHNSITGDRDTALDSDTAVRPISVAGSQGQRIEEIVTSDNTTVFAIATETGGPASTGPGIEANQYGTFQPYYYRWYGDFYSPGTELISQARNPFPYSDNPTYRPVQWDGRGQVSRGTPVALEMVLNLRSTAMEKVETVSSCMRWDPTQVYLLPMGSYPTLRQDGSNAIRGDESASSLLEVVDVSQASGGMYWNENYRAEFPKSVIASEAVRVQFGYDTGASTWSDAVGQNANECNNATGRVWVDSTNTSALEARKDAQGRYQFDMVRVVVDQMVWYRAMAEIPNIVNDPKADTTIHIGLQGVVGNDLNVNHDGKSVYLHTSRAFGDWDVDGDPQPPTTQCYPIVDSDDWSLNVGNDGNVADPAATGWCNQGYDPANENPLDNFGFWSSLDTSNMTSGVSKPTYGGSGGDSDTDRISIVIVKPLVTKSNDAGRFDIADNGDTVDFTIDVSAVGSNQEALSNFVMTDALPAGYTFVEVLEEPSTPGASCEVGDDAGSQTLRCRFSEEDPLTDTGPLPQGLSGGWSDSVKIRVKVEHVSASLTTYTQIRNTAVVASSGYGPWDPTAQTPGWLEGGSGPVEGQQSARSSASSYMPLGSAQGTITKAVDGEACTVNPTTGTDHEITDDAWAERCTTIDWDLDDSNLNEVDADGNMTFSLNYANTGNMTHTGVRLIDVLPYNGDGDAEPGSATSGDGVAPGLETVGDARYPGSESSGELGLVSVAGDLKTSAAAPQGYWVTNADPTKISRDPENGITDVLWCTSDGSGGWTPANTAQANPDAVGDCSTIENAYQITGVFAFLNDVIPDTTAALELTLDSESSDCFDVWTNSFGSRVNQINLPVRSNDMSIMNNCNPKIDIEKYDTNDGPDDLSVSLADDSQVTIAAGAHDADLPADAADLSQVGGEEALSFTVTNNGTENLVNVVVTDMITSGAATISDLACTFPGETDPTPGIQAADGNWSVAWAASQVIDGPSELEVGTSFGCTAELSGVTATEIHTDRAAVTGTGVDSRAEVDDSDDYNAKIANPGVDIEKYDTNDGADAIEVTLPSGESKVVAQDVHDADSVSELVELTRNKVELTFAVTNNGTESLTDVVVTEVVTAGGASVDDVQCVFPGQKAATDGVRNDDGSWQVTWAETFAAGQEDPAELFDIGDTFYCTAQVTGVRELHTDKATISAVGFETGVAVGDTDSYNANSDELPTLPFTGSAKSWLWLVVGTLLLGGVAYAGVVMWRRRSAS